MNFLELTNPWLWFSLAAIFLIFEFAIAGSFYPLMIAFGLFISGIVAFLIHNVIVIILVFAGILIISTLFIRPLLVLKFKVNADIRLSTKDSIKGAVAIVTKPISKVHRGEVKLEGEIWGAIAEEECEIKIGEEVIVLQVEGITLYVQPKGRG